MKLVVSSVPIMLGEPETTMVYVPAVAESEADKVKVEVQLLLGEQGELENTAVTPVGKALEAWLADKVIGDMAPLVLATVMVLEPPVASLTDVMLPELERV